jgi:hypothetical protein
MDFFLSRLRLQCHPHHRSCDERRCRNDLAGCEINKCDGTQIICTVLIDRYIIILSFSCHVLLSLSRSNLFFNQYNISLVVGGAEELHCSLDKILFGKSILLKCS